MPLLLAAGSKTPAWFSDLGHGLLIVFVVLCLPIGDIVQLLFWLVWAAAYWTGRGIVALVQLARRK